MLRGNIVAYDESAAHADAILNRAVAIRPPNIFAATVSRHWNQLVLVPGREPAIHDTINLRAN